MTDNKTKAFLEFLHKVENVISIASTPEVDEESRQRAALALTEIRFCARKLIDAIDAISKTSLNPTEAELDKLLEMVILAKINIYDELSDWFEYLKDPLEVVIAHIPVEEKNEDDDK